MAFYAARVIVHPAIANPTLLVVTDRSDREAEILNTFKQCEDLLRQPVTQAVLGQIY